MDINDVFGRMEMRPEHPDFWRISEVVLGQDLAMDESSDKDATFTEITSKAVDPDSLAYVGVQRAMRLLGTGTRAEVRANSGMVAMLASVYMDAFVTVVNFQKEGGKR